MRSRPLLVTPCYFLQRDQMLAAHEMFKNANRVSRAEKALILGFMAGARGNVPHIVTTHVNPPHQLPHCGFE